MIEFVQNLEEVADGAGQAIESPYHNHLEPAMPGIGHELVEPGTLRLGSADFVGVFLDDLVAALLGQLAQIVELGLGVLVQCGDANRHRGSGRPLSPATPPDMRVRIRRFGWIELGTSEQSWKSK